MPLSTLQPLAASLPISEANVTNLVADLATATTVTAKTVTLTNAQVITLPTTGVTLVAAPGAGSILVPIHATLRLTWVADYTNIDANGNLSVLLGTSAILGQLYENTGGAVSNLLADGEAATAFLPGIGNASTSLLSGISGYIASDVENKALTLKADNGGSSDYGGGNAGNSLKVWLRYYTVTF